MCNFGGPGSLSVTATLTWTPDSSTDTSQPPPTVNVLETANASAQQWILQATGVSTSASDGFGDPVTNPTAPVYGASSSGKHLYQATVSSGQTSVTLPTRSLSAYLSYQTAVATSGPSVGGSYTVQVFSATLQAHSTVDTSAPGNPWDPTHPRFFSGTNCSAIASAPATSGYVSHAQLLVGGTDVKDYYDTSYANHPAAGPFVTLGTNQTSALLSVNFDSTHFADASSVPIKMLITDTAGNNYDASVAANAYNKAYSLGNYQPSGGSLVYGQVAAANASSAFSGMNCPGSPTTTDGKTTILANLHTYTVFYIWTHGLDLPSVFGDCFAFPNSPDANYLYARASDDLTGATGVTQAVASKSVSVPPYNFAFCDACLTAQNNLMAGAFGVTTGSTDLAYLGYTTESDDSQYNAGWKIFSDRLK